MTSANDRYQAAKRFVKAGDVTAARAELALGVSSGEPDARLHALLAFINYREGRFSDALENCFATVEIDEGNGAYWHELWMCMGKTEIAPNPPRFFNVLSRALRVDRLDNKPGQRVIQAQISDAAARFGSSDRFLKWALTPQHDPAERAFLNLLLTFLEYGDAMDEALERALTPFRAHILATIADGKDPANSAALLELAAAMAIHCHHQEYIFEQSAIEVASIQTLVRDIEQSDAPDPVKIAIVGAYRPLQYLQNADQIARCCAQAESTRLRALVKLQILDPHTEQDLRGNIRSLTSIDDTVSLAVRSQYEENPYPRWYRIPTGINAYAGRDVRRILVAGCGTGRQAVIMSLSYPNADVWACDLSLASLSYTRRTADEYGVKNLTCFHGDLLKLDQLKDRFDIIHCTGVIHHMEDPAQGLRVLRGLLTEKGTIKLAIYAAPARKAVAAGLTLRKKMALPSTAEGIRHLRRAIYDLPPDAPARGVLGFRDFFFMSECRDLLFHVQEQDYTLIQAAALFEATQTKLIALHPEDAAKQEFQRRYPHGDTGDLALWRAIEADGFSLCGPMYTFSLAVA